MYIDFNSLLLLFKFVTGNVRLNFVSFKSFVCGFSAKDDCLSMVPSY